MKSFGILEPHRNPEDIKSQTNRQEHGPPIHQRAAVATTDFAMQNVVLQMNLELLSVDGMKIRKVKSWVLRCGACFKVHTNADGTGPIAKRLFCSHCGSDMIQRIAASVDGKTGRLRLHLKKNYRHNLRGTKYSLPKPGTGNRFQGDLLLREDQLLMGAWNQKARIRSGGKARQDAQSMFGRDLAGNVGCHAAAVTADDIRVGFGRQNPNAAKGRERRGKKKKTSEKACGLRRY
jgi:RNA-binding protein NOB1